MIIDTHSHLASEDLVAYPRDDAKPIHTGDYDLTAERFIETMDAAGVDGACVVQAFGIYGYDNAYHADAARQFPDRFTGICGLSPDLPDAPGKLRYWIRDRGMSGVRITYWGPGTNLDPADPKVLALLSEADQLGAVVLFLTTRKHLAAIKTLAARFDGLNIAIDHMGVGLGEPERVEGDVRSLAEASNVVFKFSTPLLSAGEPHKSFFRRMVDHIGPSRMMWSSDYPHTNDGGYPAMVDLARRELAFLSPAEREQAMGGTALRLWPQLSGAKAKAPA